MFDVILKDLAFKTGAQGAALLDWEGEKVASYAGSGLEMDLIGAHHGVILNLIKEVHSRHQGASSVKSVSILTGENKLAISTIKDGYCLILALNRSVPSGKAFFESDKAVKRIEAEM